jgi:hypothetical protein
MAPDKKGREGATEGVATGYLRRSCRQGPAAQLLNAGVDFHRSRLKTRCDRCIDGMAACLALIVRLLSKLSACRDSELFDLLHPRTAVHNQMLWFPCFATQFGSLHLRQLMTLNPSADSQQPAGRRPGRPSGDGSNGVGITYSLVRFLLLLACSCAGAISILLALGRVRRQLRANW